MSQMRTKILFRRDIEPIPGLKISDAIKFVGTGNLTSGSGDVLSFDKTTKEWRRWVYYKCKKRIPDLSTNIYGNKMLIEKIERACLPVQGGHKTFAESLFLDAMQESFIQLSNPRSDSAEALDRLGSICLRAGENPKAITCFEYSLHMRKLMYGKDGVHEKILQSLMLLGNSWAQYENIHRAIIVFEKALGVAKELMTTTPEKQIQLAEIYHNLGACWERLHEHHTAIECYETAEKIRRKVATPLICTGAFIKPKLFSL